jgi:transposase
MEFIGLDIHRHYAVLARMDEKGKLLDRRRLGHEALPAYLASLPERPRLAFEATSSWYYVCDLIESLVDDLVLSHPLKTRLIAEAKIKTDKVDATILADLLRTNFLPEAYLAPAPVRELRELLRLRASLVRMRTMARNKVHAVLIKRGLRPPVGNVFCQKGRRWLAEVGLSLPQSYALAIASNLRIIDALSEEILVVNAEIGRRAEASEEAGWLDSMPGIGPFTALLILAEIGDVKRFPDASRLASYAGLVPSVHSSGGRTRYGSLTRQGSPWLRWAMVQAARSAVRRPGPLQDRYRRMKQRKPEATAIVDLARFMLGCAYAMLSERRPFRSYPRGS